MEVAGVLILLLDFDSVSLLNRILDFTIRKKNQNWPLNSVKISVMLYDLEI